MSNTTHTTEGPHMPSKPLLLTTLLFMGCTPGESPASTPAAQPTRSTPGEARRTAADVARDFLAFIDSTPKPDVFERHIHVMAGELIDITRLGAPDGDPTAKIDCSGSYEHASCWNVSCNCDTLSSCGTLSSWCGAVGGKESGLSCSKSSKGGC